MVRNNEYIVSQILAMNEEELTKFLAGLSSQAQEYLDIVLAKAEKDPGVLKNYLDKHK